MSWDREYRDNTLYVVAVVTSAWEDNDDDSDTSRIQLWPEQELPDSDIKKVREIKLSLGHQCDGWVIGNEERANALTRDLHIAIYKMRELQEKWGLVK